MSLLFPVVHGPANPWRLARWSLAAALLALPWVAMHFTHEVQWTGSDFVVAGVLLFGSCALYDAATRSTRRPAYRVAAALAVLGLLLMTWINLAVGIIGSDDNPLNLVFAGIAALGVLGAAAVRIRAPGLSMLMGLLCVLQACTAGLGAWAESPKSVVISLFFAAVWLASALLFRQASMPRGRA